MDDNDDCSCSVGKRIPVVGYKWENVAYRKKVKRGLTSWHMVHSLSSLIIGVFATWAGAEIAVYNYGQATVFIALCLLAWLSFTVSNGKLYGLYKEIEGG